MMPPLEKMKCGICGAPSVRFSILGARCPKHIDVRGEEPLVNTDSEIVLVVELRD